MTPHCAFQSCANAAPVTPPETRSFASPVACVHPFPQMARRGLGAEGGAADGEGARARGIIWPRGGRRLLPRPRWVARTGTGRDFPE